MLSPADIIRALQRHWAESLSLPVPTLYPGTWLDTATVNDWYELWVDTWSEVPRRAAAPDQMLISIVVHCFSRDPVRMTAVHELAAAARQAFAVRSLPITDGSTSPPVTCGSLWIREHTSHDLSRNHAASGERQLQHLVLTFTALALATA